MDGRANLLRVAELVRHAGQRGHDGILDVGEGLGELGAGGDGGVQLEPHDGAVGLVAGDVVEAEQLAVEPVPNRPDELAALDLAGEVGDDDAPFDGEHEVRVLDDDILSGHAASKCRTA